jgi:hypothetical protein
MYPKMRVKDQNGYKNGFPLGSWKTVLSPTKVKSTSSTRKSYPVPTDDRWVNGSETLYQREKSFWQEKSPVFGGEGYSHDRKIRVTQRRHREHDELRYSVRSIFKYFNNQFSNIRILASDFYDNKKWIGQVPSWFDVEAGKQHGVSMLYTSEVYGKKKAGLPVFNSLALESVFSNVVSVTGNDVMVYMNDDMFLASPHTASDFWNPIIGLNIHIDPQSWVENQNPSVADFQWDWNSEWTALRYSNHLLSTPHPPTVTDIRRAIRNSKTRIRSPLRKTPLPNNLKRTRN